MSVWMQERHVVLSGSDVKDAQLGKHATYSDTWFAEQAGWPKAVGGSHSGAVNGAFA
jgi:hypothetical protein